MAKAESVRYEMFLRVRDFGTTHRGRFPESSKGGQLFARVAQAVTQIETQDATRVKAFHNGRTGKADARAALLRWMQDIARTARDVARTSNDSQLRLRVPGRVPDKALLDHARLFLDTGKQFSAQFLELGLSAEWESGFTAALDTYEAALTGRRAIRTDVKRAGATSAAAMADGTDAIRTLDIIVRNSLKGDPVAMSDWRAARHTPRVKAKAGDAFTLATPTPEATTPAGSTEDPLEKAS